MILHSMFDGRFWSVIFNFLFKICLCFFIFLFGTAFSLFFTYGILNYITSGQDVMASVHYLMNQTPGVVLQAFGEQIFTNIPFADFLNAVFITHITPSFYGLFVDVVTAGLSGLLFYIVARVNILISMFVKNRMLFGTVVAVETVFSICAAMCVTTWMNHAFAGLPLILLECGVLLLSVLVHTAFLMLQLKGFLFIRVLHHTILDLLTGAANNIFLWFCSFLFMNKIPNAGVSGETKVYIAAVGGFVLLGIFSLIMDTLTSVLSK